MKIVSLTLFYIIISVSVLNSDEPKLNQYEGKLVFTVLTNGYYDGLEFEVLFNNENAKIFEKHSLNISKIYIYNKKSKEFLGLYDESALNFKKTTKFFGFYSQEELIFKANRNNNQDTTIIETGEIKDILGYECRKTIIKHGNQVVFELWITDKIKPGIVYPWTPLHFENVALEFEEKVLGNTIRKYIIKSISNTQIPVEEFSQNVPDDYYLIIPTSYFSNDETNIKDEYNDIDSNISYPHFKENRIKTIRYLNEGFNKIVPTDELNESILSIEFIVNIDGSVCDIINKSTFHSINKKDTDSLNDKLNSFILNMKKWTPAKAKNIPVKSYITIFKILNEDS